MDCFYPLTNSSKRIYFMKIMQYSLFLVVLPLMSMDSIIQQDQLPSTLRNRKASEYPQPWKNHFITNALEQKNPEVFDKSFKAFYETSENIFVEQTKGTITLSEDEIEALKKIDLDSLEVYQQQAAKIILKEIEEHRKATRLVQCGTCIFFAGVCIPEPTIMSLGLLTTSYGLFKDIKNLLEFPHATTILQKLQIAQENKKFFSKEKTE